MAAKQNTMLPPQGPKVVYKADSRLGGVRGPGSQMNKLRERQVGSRSVEHVTLLSDTKKLRNRHRASDDKPPHHRDWHQHSARTEPLLLL